MSNEKFDFIVYGDFLEKNTAQAQDSLLLIQVLEQQGLLGNVICRDSISRKSFVRAIPFGSLIPKMLTAFEFIVGKKTRNFSQNVLFDYFASKQIKLNRKVIASTMGLKRCLSETKRKCGMYIEVEVTENPRSFLSKIQEECFKENIPLDAYLDLRKTLNQGVETSRKSDYIIVLSDVAKKTFVDDGYDTEKIFVLPITLQNENVFKSKELDAPLIFLYLAHTQILKGLQYLLKAWEMKKNDSCQLIIGGRIDKKIKHLFSKYQNRNDIVFLGDIQDPISLFQKSHVFVSPTKSEGAGRAILEAMATGTPVITTFYAGVCVADGIEGFVLDQNPQQIAEKMDFFLENKNMIAKMGNAARIKFENMYTSEVVRKKALSIVQSLESKNI